jgi:hypothetical protein
LIRIHKGVPCLILNLKIGEFIGITNYFSTLVQSNV